MQFRRRAFLYLPAAALLGCTSETPSAAAQPADAASLAVDVLARGLNNPWCVAFLPDGAMLITEKHGHIRRFANGQLSQALAGEPQNILRDGQSGLQDIALDPRFAENRLVYVSFMEEQEGARRLALYRARYDGQGLSEGRVIFRGSVRRGRNHPGGRMLFLPDETLLLVVGVPDDHRAEAQDLRSYLGKIVRLDREGRPPTDNPFHGRADALPEIFTLGHRNSMGLARDSETGVIWSHENGPRGGDELNLIRPGANYGWPTVTFGREYSGAIITNETSRPGFDDPVTQWTPSIAPSGLCVYRGQAFPSWQGDLLIGFLGGQQLRRLRVAERQVAEQTNLLTDRELPRIRDVREGPDGLLYVLTDGDDGELWRVRPA
ncbi:MAG: PQQ-dependent sugar dehydrogenase [Hyphomonadaceae bacterium]